MTDLSPAAKAVLDAANGAQCYGPDDCLNESRWIAAAVLRAAADQVVPEMVNAVGDEHDNARREQWIRIRCKFLSLAAELEGAGFAGVKNGLQNL
jgi:hypothetical protein